MDEFKYIEKLETLSFGADHEVLFATNQENGTYLAENGQIEIVQLGINHESNPDIALINAFSNTPVQRNHSESTIHEIILGSNTLTPSGVILMSPDKEIQRLIYNPKKQGGQLGFSIQPG